MKKSPSSIAAALLVTFVVPGLGLVALGNLPALLFLAGFLGGFILWLFLPSNASFCEIRRIYWVLFALFILHRVEEKYFGFFERLAKMTGVATPEVLSPVVLLLVAVSVGGWLLGPYLYSRGGEFGKYLVWTFLASMGITELAHFVFPMLEGTPYNYFPGMGTTLILAPLAWYAMCRLARFSLRG